MKARSLQRAEFELLLARRPLARSTHFALHHVAAATVDLAQSRSLTRDQELSTDTAQKADRSVDNMLGATLVGCMISKRHAKRAVTRNLLRRQAMAAARQCQPALAAGLWLVRLQQGWPRDAWPSAASPALRQQAGAELRTLLQDGAVRAARALGGRA